MTVVNLFEQSGTFKRILRARGHNSVDVTLKTDSMKQIYRVTTASVSAETGEMLMYSKGFANCIDAFNYAFAHGTDFVSYRDDVYDITIYDIDALTAYYENMMI